MSKETSHPLVADEGEQIVKRFPVDLEQDGQKKESAATQTADQIGLGFAAPNDNVVVIILVVASLLYAIRCKGRRLTQKSRHKLYF